MIENPYTQPHYLTGYWPVKPALIDPDRRERGDRMKKPTQYYFINFEPANNFILEPRPIRQTKAVMYLNSKSGDKTRYEQRSEITPEYANRFIREFLLEKPVPQFDGGGTGSNDDTQNVSFPF